jgi:hypothetical protein
VLGILVLASTWAAVLAGGLGLMPALAAAVVVAVPLSASFYFVWGVRRILNGLSLALGGITWQRARVSSISGAA